jgi:hypothetical protein
MAYWKVKERQYLIQNHDTQTLKAIGLELGRSVASVREMAVALRKKKILKTKSPNWTLEDHSYLVENLHRSNKVLALQLGRTYWSIKSRKRQVALGTRFFENVN